MMETSEMRRLMMIITAMWLPGGGKGLQQIKESHTKQYCTSEAFQASCGENEVILLQNAVYGRMKPGRCISAEYQHSMGCYADVTAYLDTECSGRQHCKVMVGTMDAVAQPCPKDFKSYLEATYYCVPVWYAASNCAHVNQTMLKGTAGYLAPYGAHANHQRPCPWVIKGQRGQRVNLTAINLAGSHRQRSPGSDQPTMTCPFIILVKENSVENSIDLCSNRQREQIIFTSKSNMLEIQVMSHSRRSLITPILLQYQVFGCPDVRPPLGSHVLRTGDVASVICNMTQETWYITCKGETWIGEPGNCTHVTKDAEPMNGENKAPSTFHHGIVLAVLIGVALGTFIGGFMLCIVFFIRKSSRRRHPASSATTQLSCPEDYDTRTCTRSGGPGGAVDMSCSPYPGFLCQEKACGQEVSEYTHVWNVHPPQLCSTNKDNTTATLYAVRQDPRNNTSTNNHNNAATLYGRDKLAYMELDSSMKDASNVSA